LDHDSKSEKENHIWHSYMKRGVLMLNKAKTKASVQWHEDQVINLKSTLSSGGRSMELSDLKVFDGRLLTIDDRTGVVYRLLFRPTDLVALPWVLLNDGPGTDAKGFKGEWMTRKGNELYVGGLGKEWTTTEGVFVNHNPMWIKVIGHTGFVRHVNWVENYKKLRASVGIEYPGYMIHESAQWSDVHQRWFFLPRRASKEIYSESADETRGTNYMLIADENFDFVQSRKVGNLTPARGFSAFQFIPGTKDQLIVALKSEEKDGVAVGSYITIFSIDGTTILDETPLLGQYKFEGIEFM